MSGSNILTPKPKGWSTAKLRAATLKRIDLLRGVDSPDEKKISVDAQINLLIDHYYQNRV